MLRRSLCPAAGVFAVSLVFLAQQNTVHAQRKADLAAKDIPKKVMDALKSRFPDARIDKATKETENGVVVYDLEFKQKGKKFEADIKEDGTIANWERQIQTNDLPAAAKKSVAKKYPKSSLKDVMIVTEVKGGKDALEGYEVLLTTAGKKEVEVTVAPDGRILEEPGKKK